MLQTGRNSSHLQAWRRTSKESKDFRRIERSKKLEPLPQEVRRPSKGSASGGALSHSVPQFYIRLGTLQQTEMRVLGLMGQFPDSAVLFGDLQNVLRRAISHVVHLLAYWVLSPVIPPPLLVALPLLLPLTRLTQVRINMRVKVLEHISQKSFNKKSKERLQPAIDFLSSTIALCNGLPDAPVRAYFSLSLFSLAFSSNHWPLLLHMYVCVYTYISFSALQVAGLRVEVSDGGPARPPRGAGVGRLQREVRRQGDYQAH